MGYVDQLIAHRELTGMKGVRIVLVHARLWKCFLMEGASACRDTVAIMAMETVPQNAHNSKSEKMGIVCVLPTIKGSIMGSVFLIVRQEVIFQMESAFV